jgi:hypothetical protein
MSSRTVNRKQFLVFSASAVAASALAACGDDTPDPVGASGSGSGGTAGTGTSGTGTSGTGTGGSAGSGTSGSSTGGSAAGSGGSAAGSGGSTAGSGGSGGSSAGTGGGGGTGGAGGGKCTGDIMVESSGDHKHTLLVTAAQITAGTEVTILSGEAIGHKHYVKITAADFTALKAGMEVKKKSCSGGDHEYVLKCGGGGSAPMAPTCGGDSDMCGNDDNMGDACN